MLLIAAVAENELGLTSAASEPGKPAMRRMGGATSRPVGCQVEQIL